MALKRATPLKKILMTLTAWLAAACVEELAVVAAAVVVAVAALAAATVAAAAPAAVAAALLPPPPLSLSPLCVFSLYADKSAAKRVGIELSPHVT
jgi:hypothetical protein